MKGPKGTETPFTLRMWDLVDDTKKYVPGYFPHDFHRMLIEARDDFAPKAKELLRTGIQDGLLRLAKGRAIEISMEASIAWENWPEFTKEDRDLAVSRMKLAQSLVGLDAKTVDELGASHSARRDGRGVDGRPEQHIIE